MSGAPDIARQPPVTRSSHLRPEHDPHAKEAAYAATDIMSSMGSSKGYSTEQFHVV